MKILMECTDILSEKDITVQVFQQECVNGQQYAELTVYNNFDSCSVYLTKQGIKELVELLNKAGSVLDE